PRTPSKAGEPSRRSGGPISMGGRTRWSSHRPRWRTVRRVRLAEARVCPGAGCCGRWDTCLVPLTVLIVDDHEGFRQVARELLEADGIEVVGEAVDGESAITEAARLRPQLVLLDVQLPVAGRPGQADRGAPARRRWR